MDEDEWLACSDASALIADEAARINGGEEVSERKRRLFACACARRVSRYLTDPRSADALAMAEAFADDDREPEAILAASRLAEDAARAVREHEEDAAWYYVMREAADAIPHATNSDLDDDSLNQLLNDCANAYGQAAVGSELHAEWAERRTQADLFRDIFGPFNHNTFPADWRTDTAMSLARGMYASRDFSAMPILADALQDAGCDSDDILNHCRDANQPHVRGCWVVDLLLGKA